MSIMAAHNTGLVKVCWYLIPVRVLLVTFLTTLLSCAVCLLAGILGAVIAASLRGVPPDLTMAYRNIAVPGAAVAGAIVLITATAIEIRRYRQVRALAEIERMCKKIA